MCDIHCEQTRNRSFKPTCLNAEYRGCGKIRLKILSAMMQLERLPMRAHALAFGSGSGATLSVLLEEARGF